MKFDEADTVGGSQKLQLIWGARSIAQELGVPLRRAWTLLQTGKLPARKIGKLWCVDRRVLAKFFLDV